MVIYEVNLVIERAIYADFLEWLRVHVQEMLEFEGFKQASILKQEVDEGSTTGGIQEHLTIHYQVENREYLAHYLTHGAPKMREAGFARFNTQYSATRRIFSQQDHLENTRG